MLMILLCAGVTLIYMQILTFIIFMVHMEGVMYVSGIRMKEFW